MNAFQVVVKEHQAKKEEFETKVQAAREQYNQVFEKIHPPEGEVINLLELVLNHEGVLLDRNCLA